MQDDIIKLKSKSTYNNYLKLLKKSNGSESKTYVLKSDNPNICLNFVDNKKCINPPGGPTLIEGAIIPETSLKIKHINFIIGYGHTITIE